MLVPELRVHVDRVGLCELGAGGSCLINPAFLSITRFEELFCTWVSTIFAVLILSVFSQFIFPV